VQVGWRGLREQQSVLGADLVTSSEDDSTPSAKPCHLHVIHRLADCAVVNISLPFGDVACVRRPPTLHGGMDHHSPSTNEQSPPPLIPIFAWNGLIHGKAVAIDRTNKLLRLVMGVILHI
jgi:hypothetical protein